MKRALLLGLGIVFLAISLAPPSASSRGLGGAPRGVPVTLGIDALFCYGGASPVGSIAACGAGSSSTTAPANTVLPAWEIINLPGGNQFSESRVIYTPSDVGEWQSVSPACPGPNAANECNPATVTGEHTARVDILCTGAPDDILGGPGGTGGTPATQWPDSVRWPTHSITRTAASVANGGFGLVNSTSGSVYVDAVKPQPPSFVFSSLDTAVVTQVYLAGVLPFPLPNPVHWQRATYERNFGTTFKPGMQTSAILFTEDPVFGLGGNCIDTPEQSVSSATYLKTPATPGYYVRWVAITLQSNTSGVVTKAVASGCVNVGGYGAPDADGDCLEDALDPNDANTDTDGDLLLDGVEKANFTCITSADIDADGVSDFEEMFNFTKPNGGVNSCVASTACSALFSGNPAYDIDPNTIGIQYSPFFDTNDTDCDGQRDLWDTGAGWPTDTDADDNCPTVFNPQQENSDADNQHHSMGVGTGDLTNPDQDWSGDACDWDDDNDGIGDFAESQLRIREWAGVAATLCTFGLVGTVPMVNGPGLDPLNGDTDLDLVLDGAECNLRSRPDIALKSVAECVVGDPDGCAQPNNGLAGGASLDPDGDGLFQPFCGVCHGGVELLYRTFLVDIDGDGPAGAGDKDSDRDHPNGLTTSVWLQDGLESRNYGTQNWVKDTDRDGCSDVHEVTDVSGDRKVTSGDQLGWVIKRNQTPNAGKLDPDNDGDVDYLDRVNFDFNRNKLLDAGDQLIMAAVIGAGGGVCPAFQMASTVKNGSWP